MTDLYQTAETLTHSASALLWNCLGRSTAAAASANSLAIVRLFSEPSVLRPAAVYFLYLSIFVYFS
jgi:hypothetical protein